MPVYTVKAGGAPPPDIEDDIYLVECIAVSPVDLVETDPKSPNFNKPKADQFGRTALLQFDFLLTEVDDDSGDHIILKPRTSRIFSPKSTAYAYAVALGVEPVIGESFDTDVLIGKRARANVQAQINADGSRGWPRVKDLIALPRGKAAGGRPVASQKASNAAPPEPIGEWWAEARKGGRSQAMVTEASKRMYKGLTPIQLDAEQRAVLLVAIERWTMIGTVECAEGEHDLAFNEDGVMVCRKCAADVSEMEEAV